MKTQEQRRADAAFRLQQIEDIKNALARKHGLSRNDKFEKAWNLAWDYGHSSGYDEVQLYFDELAELLKP